MRKKMAAMNFIFDKISPLLLGNDLVVANLEGPITDKQICKRGYRSRKHG